jgi:hypothetical protein
MYILFVPILNGFQKQYDLLYFYCLSYLKFSSESIYIDKKLSNYFYFILLLKFFIILLVKLLIIFQCKIFLIFLIKYRPLHELIYFKINLDSTKNFILK